MKPDHLVPTADRMVERIHKINTDDPGTRAALRRGLGRCPQDIANFHAHAVVAPYLPEQCDHATERAFYTVAALVAAQPRGARDQETGADNTGEESTSAQESTGEPVSIELSGEPAVEPTDTGNGDAIATSGSESQQKSRRNLGQTLAWAVENGNLADNPKRDPVRDRLHVLARYRTDRMHRELPKLIRYLRAELVEVDWGYLLRDLSDWDQNRDQVAKRWVQHYHRTRSWIQRNRQRKSNEPTTPNNSESEQT